MGLANALRRIRGLPPQSDPSPSPSPHHQNNSKRHSPYTPKHSSSPRRHQRRSPHPIIYGQPAGNNVIPSHHSSSQHDLRTRKQISDQERVVIESYRTRVVEIADDIIMFLPEFDSDRESLNLKYRLTDMRTHLTKAIESYRAALGRNSNLGIDQVLNLLREVDKKLHFKPTPISSAVSSSHPDDKLLRATYLPGNDTGSYSPAVLKQLERYHCGRHQLISNQFPQSPKNPDSPIYPSKSELTDKSASAYNLPNHNSSSSGETFASAMPYPRLPSDLANGHAPTNGYRYANAPTNSYQKPNPNGYHQSTSRDNSHESYQEPNSSSQSFSTSEKILKHTPKEPKYPSPTAYPDLQPWVSSPDKPSKKRPAVHTRANGHHSPHVSKQSTKIQPLSPHSRTQRPPTPDDRREDGNSESGDEGPLHLVTSRTTTSLHDRAESARSQTDDAHSSHNAGANVPDSFREDTGQGEQGAPHIPYMPYTSRQKYSTNGKEVRKEVKKEARKEGERRSLPKGNNMSFASTLYQTRHARVDSITDAGVFLTRSNVRGDGRCLFRALVRCRAFAKGVDLPGERVEREEADRLRARSVEELRRQRELLDRFFVIEGDFEQYLGKMSYAKTYGGEPELLMLAKVLHVPIAVYILRANAYRQIQVYGKQYRGEPLRILYSDGVHYDALFVVEGRKNR